MSESAVEPTPQDGSLQESPQESEAVVAEPAEKEWWDDPAMPWRHKPDKKDVACMAWIGVVAVFGLAMLPLRGWLLGRSVPVMLAVMGSRTSAAGLGSLVRVGDFSPVLWVLPMLAGVIMANKFDWVYWWAGKLWGRGMIEVWAGQSERAARNYARAERWAVKWGAVGIFIAYVPIPLPLMAVVFVLAGASGMSVKRFLVLDCISCLVWLLLHFGLGYLIGEPAVFVLQQYAKYANYVAIALVVFVIGTAVLNGVRKARAVI
ncbi:MAG: VTT domain-containing protein [Propionibacteriaceae bacterium]|nr:VTT domain-containing protein [Propionibacteriaceae bacterium]